MRRLRATLLSIVFLCLAPVGAQAEESQQYFSRVSSYPLSLNRAEGPTAAEIVAVDATGTILVYADSLGGGVGFVDISVPAQPRGLGYLALEGEPTSVVIKDDYCLVALNHGAFRGSLAIVSLPTRKLLTTLPLAGQPDCIALNPLGTLAVVGLENESTDGISAAPEGQLQVFDLHGPPTRWQSRTIGLSGLAEILPDDPEPEYIAINQDSLAAVSLQENNHIVLIDLLSDQVVNHFSAGLVELKGRDLKKDKKVLFEENGGLVPREPDAVEWCSLGLVTADEGDWKGGGRGFSIFSDQGKLLYSSGNQTEEIARDLGQYPDFRSPQRGTEPESLKVANFGDREMLFVGCERSNLVLVYQLTSQGPRHLQALPTAVGPESIAVVPSRGLVLVGSEVDKPSDGLRSCLTIFELGQGRPNVPTLLSENGIAWGALSGLTSNGSPNRLYSVCDKAVLPNRVLTLDTSQFPYRLTEALEIRKDGLPTSYDPEGLAVDAQGNFWLVSEGDKSSPHLLIELNSQGEVLHEHPLPASVLAKLKKHGMEGVAVLGASIFVAFQSSGSDGQGRLGRFRPDKKEWSFATYPLDKDEFASALSHGPEHHLLLLRRNKATGENFLQSFPSDFKDGAHLEPTSSTELNPYYEAQGYPVPSKLEGMTFDGEKLWLVNDNDAVKESRGETILLSIPFPLEQYQKGTTRQEGKEKDE